jgi:hypothetical protein
MRPVKVRRTVTRFKFDPEDNWDNCSELSSLDIEYFDIPDDISDLTTLSEIEEDITTEKTKRIGHLPRAEERAYNTFMKIDGNIYHLKSLGSSPVPDTKRTCGCPQVEGGCIGNSGCINRCLLIECKDPDCSPSCGNRRYAPIIYATTRNAIGLNTLPESKMESGQTSTSS